MQIDKIRKSIYVLYLIICLLGLSWHVYQICDPYFEYKTSTKIEMTWPLEERSKSINLCIYVDYDNDTLTLSKLWDRMPEITDVIGDFNSSCLGLKKSNSNLDCNDITMSKYVNGRNVCYKFSLKDNINFNGDHFKIKHPGVSLMYILIDYSKLSKHKYGYLFLSDDSESENSVLQRRPNAVELHSYLYYTMTASTFQTKRLEYPFQDNCVYYTSYDNLCKSRVDCLSDCMANYTLENFDMLYLYKTRYEPEDKNFWYNRWNGKANLEFEKLILKCVDKYPHRDCYDYNSMTYLYNSLVDDSKHVSKNIFILKYGLFARPSTLITSIRQVALVDFITFVLGSLGTWLGFSFLGIDPSRFLEHKISKQMREKQEQENIKTYKNINDTLEKHDMKFRQINFILAQMTKRE